MPRREFAQILHNEFGRGLAADLGRLVVDEGHFHAAVGVLLGSLVKDVTGLFTVIKSLGIILYAPGIFYMFPSLPAWMGKFFPTYYVIQPVLDITQNNANFADIWLSLVLVAVFSLVVMGLIGIVSRRQKEALAAV